MSLIRISDLADLLHRRSNPWKALALLRAYFDESGTHAASPVTAIAGYVGTKAVWDQIEIRWAEILEPYRTKGVTVFHMADALAQAAQYELIEKPFVSHIIMELANLLGSSAVAPVFSAVVVDDWHDVVTDQAFLARFPTPIALCFDDIVRQLSEWSLQNAGNEKVAPVFAYRTEYTTGHGMGGDVLKLYGAQDWYKKALAPIAFGWPSEVIPLQGADLLAHQIRADIDKVTNQPVSLAASGRTKALYAATGGWAPHGHYFTADALELSMKRFKETGEIYPLS